MNWPLIHIYGLNRATYNTPLTLSPLKGKGIPKPKRENLDKEHREGTQLMQGVRSAMGARRIQRVLLQNICLAMSLR